MRDPADAAARTDVINTIGRIAVSVFVLILFMGVCFVVLLKSIPPSETATLVIGAVVGMAGTVIAYWVGSSSGSTAKDARQAAMTPPPPPGGTTTVTTPPAAPPGSTTVTTTPATTTVATPEGTTTTTGPTPPIIVQGGTIENSGTHTP